MFSSAIVSLALTASALANVFVTSPVSSTTYTAGQQVTVTWQDDGSSPSLAQFGNATLAVYVGNAIQQTPLQTIATYIDVSIASAVVFTPDPSIGPNSNEYFIRVTSQTLMNPSDSQYYEEAFSAKFTMTGMTGSFNSSIQAEIDGQSTAPLAAATSATGSSSSGATSTPVPSVTSASATTAAPTDSTSGAGKPAIATGFVGLVAALIGAAFL